MSGYTKLFGSIIGSTIWNEDPATCKIWITMLALANADGIVEASVPGLAHLARIELSVTLRALQVLESPDEHSRTKDFEGRRIIPIDGGWKILNHSKYRALGSKDNANNANALRQKRWREKQRQIESNKRNAVDVTNNVMSRQAEAEAEAYTDKQQQQNGPSAPFALKTRWGFLVSAISDKGHDEKFIRRIVGFCREQCPDNPADEYFAFVLGFIHELRSHPNTEDQAAYVIGCLRKNKARPNPESMKAATTQWRNVTRSTVTEPIWFSDWINSNDAR